MGMKVSNKHIGIDFLNYNPLDSIVSKDKALKGEIHCIDKKVPSIVMNLEFIPAEARRNPTKHPVEVAVEKKIMEG